MINSSEQEKQARTMNRSRRILLSIILTLLVTGSIRMTHAHAWKENWPPGTFLIYYGPWGPVEVEKADPFDLIVLHPGRSMANITPELIRTLKEKGREGKKERLVIAYVSIGEDEEVPRGPADVDIENRGPVYFDPGTRKIRYMERGYPTRYLDEMKYILDEKGFFSFLPSGVPATSKGHDGIPDENGVWDSFYVYAGDRAWQKLLIEKMEVLSRDFGVDGFFLDTLDTASPWGNYGWMQKDMALLIKTLREHFPRTILMANRGFFLLEDHADLFRSSIDGLLFESFSTEWNWQMQKGVQSPYIKANTELLHKSIEPNARGNFHLFVLNYLSTAQQDFFPLLTDEQELLKEIPHTSYITTPDLQTLFPPPETYFSLPGKKELPVPESFSVKETGRGVCTATFRFLYEKIGTHMPGRDFYIDLRVTSGDTPPEQFPLLPPLPVDYSTMNMESDGRYISFLFSIPGFQKGRDLRFLGRITGREPSQSLLYQDRLMTAEGPYPNPVEAVRAEGREQSVQLTWQNPNPGCRAFRVYVGTEAAELTCMKTVNEKEALAEKLENEKLYYFSISALSPEGVESTLSLPVAARPRATVPPLPPELIDVHGQEDSITITWQKQERQELKNFNVYCYADHRGLRLPLLAGPALSSMTVRGLKKGTLYKVFVTSVERSGLESTPSRQEEITLPSP
jgi:hypothetical protein